MWNFELPAYSKITKCEKADYYSIKRTIFRISQTLGESTSTRPVPYDTAWVARVSEVNNLMKPAFPQCLQWLRDFQNEDGTWGDDCLPMIHSQVLNTFAAILALSQWNQQEDAQRIANGINALRKLAEILPKVETENSVFEMILSGMVDDAQEFALNIPSETFEWFSKIGTERLKQNKSKIISNIPNPYWAFLEATGKTLDIRSAYYRAEIKRHGLIAAQPSTTAFVLQRARLGGENYPEAEWALERLILENNGGLPHLHRCDNFELIHGLDLFVKAGINPVRNEKNIAVTNAIETLQRRWNPENGIGFSSKWPFLDEGCTNTTSDILKKTSTEGTERDKVEPILKRKKKDMMRSNINDSQRGHLLSGTIRNISKYYHLMQEAFESDLKDPKIVSVFTKQIVKSQNGDGGWGGNVGTSSAEETAYICLTIYLLIKYDSQVLHDINFLKLSEFVRNVENLSVENSFWCWKVAFSSSTILEVSITAAKYAVFQMQRLCIMTDALNENELDFEIICIKDGNGEHIFQGYCLRLYEPFRLEDINFIQKQIKESFMKNILELESISDSQESVIEASSEFSYLSHSGKISISRRLNDLIFLVYLFIIDNVVDEFLPGKKIVEDEMMAFFCVIIDTLEGKYKTPLDVPTIDFPGFANLITLLFHEKNAIWQNKWNADNFIKELKRLIFHAHFETYKDFSKSVEPTIHRYLQVHKLSSALPLLLQHYLMTDGVETSAEAENLDVYKKYLDSACKVCRMYADFACVPKDELIPTYDNYCLRLQLQYKISMQEAVQMTVKKANKEILKMYALKSMIKNDPQYTFLLPHLSVRMKYVANILDGTLIWSLTTHRYKSTWVLENSRVYHKKKDLTFVRNLCFN